jgi:hypothetical protein
VFVEEFIRNTAKNIIMKNALRKMFSPILNIFESGDEPYVAKPLNRKILIVIGVLFSFLVSVVIYLSYDKGEPGYLIPVVVFSSVAIVALIVGFLGTDRAVAKIWGNR